MMNYDMRDEYIMAFDKLVTANKNDCELFMLLAEVVGDSKTLRYLRK